MNNPNPSVYTKYEQLVGERNALTTDNHALRVEIAKWRAERDVLAADLAGQAAWKERYLRDYLGANERVRALEESLSSIQRYGLDTLSGRVDGLDDRDWQRAAVNEMTKRARIALEPTPLETISVHTTEQDVQHWLSYSGNGKYAYSDAVRAAYYAGAGATMETHTDYPPSFKGWMTGPCQTCGYGKDAHAQPDMFCPTQREPTGEQL